ncbi:metallophosphoesterase [Klebsiella pneumoniae]|uniref:metallophosphoesterase n=1 Tax=Klebsiella TaxID=570 RepID=UPI000651A1A3|nr:MULTISPECIES: metallophosphoesterase [Klebsiella]WCS67814.1 metallophosphoesterase [Klebsiella phage vB_KpnP_BUCT711]AMA31619.1 serine/threonine protein phosphatase [Klebsiella pneumoniae subsp. pneumoniae]AOE32635.1 serine/threonine protein phosphatase [Klebsiella pneumoniae]AUN58532.1 serine/threonine protein phosphatase [Klebsiella pneumoniae]AUN69138.1 serine/threonine protein phosphatase [Klebsiella pneumoniae]
MKIYQRINGEEWRRVLVCGDLHGCYTNLMSSLDKAGFDPVQDLLVSVGDLIDRGQESFECLDLINQPWFRAVRGNHEQMMLDAITGTGSFGHWMSNGGGWWHSLDYEQDMRLKSLLPKVAELPLIIEVEKGGKKFVICHADYPHDEYEYGKPVDSQQAIWSRERISLSIDGFSSSISGADLFIFGHTPALQPMRNKNQLYIDTGAVFNGNLTLYELSGGE